MSLIFSPWNVQQHLLEKFNRGFITLLLMFNAHLIGKTKRDELILHISNQHKLYEVTHKQFLVGG